MKRFCKKENLGITLIALVITIIILLILAGVTIGVAINGTGLFEKAKLATDEYNNKAKQEETQIAKYTNEIDRYVDGNRDTVTIPKEEYDELKEKSKTIKIETKTPKNINEWVKVADYPNGYTSANVYLKSFKISLNNDTDINFTNTGFQFKSDGIYMVVANSGKVDKSIEILLGVY